VKKNLRCKLFLPACIIFTIQTSVHIDSRYCPVFKGTCSTPFVQIMKITRKARIEICSKIWSYLGMLLFFSNMFWVVINLKSPFTSPSCPGCMLSAILIISASSMQFGILVGLTISCALDTAFKDSTEEESPLLAQKEYGTTSNHCV
jgi:hypothetical protein